MMSVAWPSKPPEGWRSMIPAWGRAKRRSFVPAASRSEAGTKDLRFALPNAGIMLRQPSGGFEGQATDIMVHAREILSLKKRLNEIYVRHTGQPLKKIEQALERDYFLTAEMARDFGVVDKVIEKRLSQPADTV